MMQILLFPFLKSIKTMFFFGMDVYHYSIGNMERIFCENMFLFQKKWKNKLPYCLPGYKVSFWQECKAAREVFSLSMKNGFISESFKSIYRMNSSISFFIQFFMLLPPIFLMKKWKSLTKDIK